MSKEIYIKEMPKSCKECCCCSCDLKPEFIKVGTFMYCNLLRQKFRFKEDRKKLKDCPLKSLHDHDKELVAKVLESVKNEASKDGFYDEDGNKIITYHINNYILDQIQKEFENE